MKNLFSVKTLAAAFIAGGMMFSFSACTEEDPCEDIACVNGTLTESGSSCSCVCEAGYEGDDCTTLTRTKFLGTWGVTEDCSQSAPATYSVTIASSPNGNDQVLISNFWDAFGSAVVATVDGDQLTIASQEPDNDDYFVNGTGTITTTNGVSTITITYNVEDRSQTPTVTDVCTGSSWIK